MTIGSNIKKIRKEKKLSQQELSELMGISRSYLSDVENDRYNPSIKTITQLAKQLGVSTTYLMASDSTERVKTLVDSLEELVQIDFRFKHLYDLNYKFNLIDEINQAVYDPDALMETRGLNLKDDGTLLRYIKEKIYEYDKTFMYTPFDDRNAIRFSADQLAKAKSEIAITLRKTGISELLKKQIDEAVFKAIREIENFDVEGD